jgi:hypothetical protein
MSQTRLGTATAVNPFSTRCIRPGALPFLFYTGNSPVGLVDRMVALGGRAQIVGPHGVGKSTLLAALVPALSAAGPVSSIALHDGQRRLPPDWRANAARVQAHTVVVDGFVQLSRWQRWQLKRRCARHEWNLLVTAHQDVGLPTLLNLAPSLSTLLQVADRLQLGFANPVPSEQVARRFESCRGNLREALLALYDDYERRRADGAVFGQVSDRDGCADGAVSASSASGDVAPATAGR